jgi:hypothetical protein
VDLKTGKLSAFDEKSYIPKRDYFVTTKMSLCSVEYQLRIEKYADLGFDRKLELLIS